LSNNKNKKKNNNNKPKPKPETPVVEAVEETVEEPVQEAVEEAATAPETVEVPEEALDAAKEEPAETVAEVLEPVAEKAEEVQEDVSEKTEEVQEDVSEKTEEVQAAPDEKAEELNETVETHAEEPGVPDPTVVTPTKQPDPQKAAKAVKHREKEQKKALKKQQKELARARKKQAKAAEKQMVQTAAEVSGPPAAVAEVAAISKKEARRNRRRYGLVMSTGSFLGSYILMLIPGVNILCVLIWALGGAKNRNKVHFSRASILFFLIEILLSALLLAGVYIYFDNHQAKYLKMADDYTGGLFTYLEIDDFHDLTKLKDVAQYLVDKEPEEEPEPEPTRVMENPDEITSYEQFLELYNAYVAERDSTAETEETTTAASTDDNEKTDTGTATKAQTLEDILKAHNIDPTESGLVYIILNEGNQDTIIAFDPTGDIQSVPTIQVSGEYIYVGGGN